MPVTICAAIRVGSKTTPSAVENWKSLHPYAETIVKSAELALEANRAREGGGDQEPDEDVPPFDLGDHATASFCFLPISSMPEAARSTSVSSSARVNGTRSAVACTSISRPSSVMTTFMSTSAEESST